MEFRDLKVQYIENKSEIDAAIQSVLDNTDFIGGSEVKRLEKRLAQYIGVRHCISCANGTDALSLVMMAWDIKEGDAVFIPDFTFFATGEIVALRGATPIFVDVEEDTFNIDILKLEEAIVSVLDKGKLRAKAIIPVDLFGLPANYPEIEKIARKYSLLILEDGAQGFGGSIAGRMACSFGNAAATSFFPAKPLGCYGDGGAIFTNNDELAVLLNSYKTHGKGKNKYDNVRIGINSRLDTIQAAILNVKLSAFIEYELDSVNKIYRLYNKNLQGIVQTPVIPKEYVSGMAQYTIKLRSKSERDTLKAVLAKGSIPSMIYYPKPMHRQEAFSQMIYTENDFKVTNRLCETVLSLPMHPYMKNTDVNKVSAEITKIMLHRGGQM